MSAYSTISIDCPDALPLTGATTAESSPCLTEPSPVLQSSRPDGKQLPRPASSSRLLDSAPRPPRKRESGFFQLESISSYGSLYRSQSLSMMSEGWMCSNEDLEPEVRDCVSTLSGRLNGIKNIEWANLKQEHLSDSPSVDSIATTILSSRGMRPGSAPLLQQCSSKDHPRLLSVGSSNQPAECPFPA